MELSPEEKSRATVALFVRVMLDPLPLESSELGSVAILGLLSLGPLVTRILLLKQGEQPRHL